MLPGVSTDCARKPWMHNGIVEQGRADIAFGHFMGELLQQYANIKLNQIPFKGGSEISRELLAGRIDMGMLSYNSLLPAIQAKGARVIAVPGSHRRPNLPDVRTVGETYPGYSISSWTGLLYPLPRPMPFNIGSLRRFMSR